MADLMRQLETEHDDFERDYGHFYAPRPVPIDSVPDRVLVHIGAHRFWYGVLVGVALTLWTEWLTK